MAVLLLITRQSENSVSVYLLCTANNSDLHYLGTQQGYFAKHGNKPCLSSHVRAD